MMIPINKLFRMFDREIKGVHQSALLLGIMGVLTKALALVRDRLLAGTFGAGPELDIYFAAFRMPDFIFTLTLFITASASLIPIFLKEISKSKKDANQFLSGILTFFLIFFFFLCLAAFVLAPLLARIIAPGFSEKQLSMLVVLTRIILLSPFFLGLSNLASIVIQSFQKFFIYALSPLFYNFGIILGILTLYPRYGMNGLAWGVVIGALLHLLVQLPSLAKLKFIPRPTLRIFSPIIKRAYLLSFSRTLGLSFHQLTLIVLTAVASFFSAGSISIFNFANNLQSIPLSVVGLSYSLAAFPVLSRLFIHKKNHDYFNHVSSALRHIIFWSLPISILFIVLRAHIVRSVLGAGAFGWVDTRLTAASLALFSVSITAQSLVLLFVRAYYAAGKTLKPLVINIMSSFCVIFISFAFIWFLSFSSFKTFFGVLLRVEGITGIEVLALPFAFSVGSIINAALLWRYFIKDFGSFGKLVGASLKQNILSGLALGFTAYLSLQIFGAMINTDTFLGIFFQGFLAGISGVLAGFLILRFLKNKELTDIVASLRTRFWKAPVIGEETETLI